MPFLAAATRCPPRTGPWHRAGGRLPVFGRWVKVALFATSCVGLRNPITGSHRQFRLWPLICGAPSADRPRRHGPSSLRDGTPRCAGGICSLTSRGSSPTRSPCWLGGGGTCAVHRHAGPVLGDHRSDRDQRDRGASARASGCPGCSCGWANRQDTRGRENYYRSRPQIPWPTSILITIESWSRVVTTRC